MIKNFVGFTVVVVMSVSLVVLSKSGRTYEVKEPMSYLNKIADEYSVNEYTCVFEKHEIVNGKQMPRQVMEVRFRDNPFSVYMRVRKNPSGANEILYVEGKFINSKGEECMIVKPSNLLIALMTPSLFVSINDPTIYEKSRNNVSAFGIQKMLQKFMESVKRHGNCTYVGTNKIGGKPTHTFSHWIDDKVVVMHVDAEQEIPVACKIYKSDVLIGSYKYTSVDTDVKLTDKDFSRSTYGM